LGIDNGWSAEKSFLAQYTSEVSMHQRSRRSYLIPSLLLATVNARTLTTISSSESWTCLDSSSHILGLRGGTVSVTTEAELNDKENTAMKSTELVGGDSRIRFLFSDVDGTLVHYPAEPLSESDLVSVMRLPPSSTGMQGIISTKTLQLAQKLRHKYGIKLVLVSGMRTSTLMKRLPYLPRADAYASEAGGRVFYPTDGPGVVPVAFDAASDNDMVPFDLKEDFEWRSRIAESNAAGKDGYYDDVPIKDRVGLLWDFARTLIKDGYIIDYKGYATCFRVNRKQQTEKMNDSKFDLLRGITPPAGLTTSVNLGCIDFYPEMSGKKNCCQYLAGKLSAAGKKDSNALSRTAICMCDDGECFNARF
jgi:hypothetical protein